MALRIVSAWAGSAPPWLPLVIDNHRRYAEEHGYEYEFVSLAAPRGPSSSADGPFVAGSWTKVDVLESALRYGCESVFWIDADSIFWNGSAVIEKLAPAKPIVLHGDAWNVCSTAHLFFRNDPMTIRLIDEWQSLRSKRFPRMNMTHQGESGLLVDQPALNMVLAKGFGSEFCPLVDLVQAFHGINGYRGNPQRALKFFEHTHAPTRRRRIARSLSLISADWRPSVGLVEQRKFEAYPKRLPGSPRTGDKEALTMHFPGTWKDLIPEFAEIASKRIRRCT